MYMLKKIMLIYLEFILWEYFFGNFNEPYLAVHLKRNRAGFIFITLFIYIAKIKLKMGHKVLLDRESRGESNDEIDNEN